MPDLRAKRGYHSRLLKVEQDTVRAIKGQMRDWRRRAVEEGISRGVFSPAYQAWLIGPGGRELEERLTRTMLGRMPVVERVAGEYAAEQFRTLSRFFEVPEVTEAMEATKGARDALARLNLQNPSWAGKMTAGLVAGIARLASAGEDTGRALDDLFSDSLAGGRASPYRVAEGAVGTAIGLGLWSTSQGILNRLYNWGQRETDRQWFHQVIAAIDPNTTETCLLAHGQIQPINEPFQLEGTPRFEDEMMATPFHHGCRSVVSAYVEEMEQVGVETDTMLEEAQAERARRTSAGFHREAAAEGLGL